METHQLSSVGGFALIDLGASAAAVGPARLGTKLLPSNATPYVRDITYGFGLIGAQLGGMTLGLKVDPADRAAAIEAVAAELSADLGSGRFRLDAGLRMPASALAPFATADPRPASRLEAHGNVDLMAHLDALGILASAENLLDSLEGKSVSIEGLGPTVAATVAMFAAAGATFVRCGVKKTCVEGDLDPQDLAAAVISGEEALGSLGHTAKPWSLWKPDVDLVIAGSAVGVVSDAAATLLGDTPIVGYGTAPIATKALASSMKAGGSIVPSFLSTLGRRVADSADTDATAEQLITTTGAKLSDALDVAFAHDRGPFLGACIAAEEFIGTWNDPPFGRPLA
ncbi:MAG: hypothetical protein GXP35_05940 [Actinobacteria bacterium]|nr:hypothetical protein [Actinomycetota bacterium]